MSNVASAYGKASPFSTDERDLGQVGELLACLAHVRRRQIDAVQAQDRMGLCEAGARCGRVPHATSSRRSGRRASAARTKRVIGG